MQPSGRKQSGNEKGELVPSSRDEVGNLMQSEVQSYLKAVDEEEEQDMLHQALADAVEVRAPGNEAYHT